MQVFSVSNVVARLSDYLRRCPVVHGRDDLLLLGSDRIASVISAEPAIAMRYLITALISGAIWMTAVSVYAFLCVDSWSWPYRADPVAGLGYSSVGSPVGGLASNETRREQRRLEEAFWWAKDSGLMDIAKQLLYSQILLQTGLYYLPLIMLLGAGSQRVLDRRKMASTRKA
jgi:hypothetical protein